MPLVDDLRQALRSLRFAPGFSAAVVLCLAFGLAASIGGMSFINAAVFRPFPGVERQQELVRLTFQRKEVRAFGTVFTYRDFETLGPHINGLAGLSAFSSVGLVVSIRDRPQRLSGALVSANYFDVIGARPVLGRAFLPEEDRDAWRSPAAVISHAVWTRDFNSDPGVLGQTLLVNGTILRIIGVAPPRFSGVRKGRYNIAVWIPFGLAELAWRDDAGHPASARAAGPRELDYVGRRRPGVSIEQIQDEVTGIARGLDAGDPARKDTIASVNRVWLNDPTESLPAVAVFMSLPLMVLAIGCLNAANLLMARAASRTREWAIRLALGSAGWRLGRQLLLECLLLAFGATAVALPLAWWGARIAETYLPVPMPIDFTVTVFAVAVASLTAIAFGLGPALSVARSGTRASTAFRLTSVPSRSRLRLTLVTVQVALSLGLLATGAQFTRTVQRMTPVETVPDPDRLVLASFDLDPLRVAPQVGEDFYNRLLERVSARPDVAAAGLLGGAGFWGAMGRNITLRVWLPTDAQTERRLSFVATVRGNVLGAMGLPLVAGRTFDASHERPGRPSVALVNQAFAKAYLGGNAVQRVIRVGAPGSDDVSSSRDVTIIGVVTDARMKPHSQPTIYLPNTTYEPALTLLLRFSGPPDAVRGTLEDTVRQIDSRVPIAGMTTGRERNIESAGHYEWQARLVGGLGVLALFLAACGLYSVMSYLVASRFHEIGVRIALGARPSNVLLMIGRQALTPAAVGCLLGAAGAAAAGAIVRSRLHGASAVDPMAFIAAAALLAVTLIVATIIPARRAARLDPVVALRQE
jgi:predicted permease